MICRNNGGILVAFHDEPHTVVATSAGAQRVAFALQIPLWRRFWRCSLKMPRALATGCTAVVPDDITHALSTIAKETHEMTQPLMRCANCDYFQPCEPKQNATEGVPVHGECRRRPPAMFSRRVVESDPVPVFDDTMSYIRVPVSYEVLSPAFPQVNNDFWCGDGRWTKNGTRKLWGRRDGETDCSP